MLLCHAFNTKLMLSAREYFMIFSSRRVITFANRSDFISFRHHTYLMPKGAKSVELTEVRVFSWLNGY